MHPFEIRWFDFLDVDQFALAPEAEFRDMIIEEVNAHINLLLGIGMELKLERANGELSVGVCGSVKSEAENIFGGLEGRRDFEFSKQRALLLQSSLKTKIRDLLGGRVNLAVVVSVDFLAKDLLGRLDGGDIFSDASSN